ncbi:MAG: hypothetical protein WB586_20400 [Chthoniobacterales bacterium]
MESVHRTAGGGRKDDDYWGDLQLESLGIAPPNSLLQAVEDERWPPSGPRAKNEAAPTRRSILGMLVGVLRPSSSPTLLTDLQNSIDTLLNSTPLP